MQLTARRLGRGLQLISVFSELRGGSEGDVRLTARRVLWVVATAALVAGCLADQKAGAQSVVAEGKVRELAGCLREHRRMSGSYPAGLSELRAGAAKTSVACTTVGDEFLAAPGKTYAAYRFAYAGGGGRFELIARPDAELPYACEFRLTEQFVLRRSCSGRFGAHEVVDRSLLRPGEQP